MDIKKSWVDIIKNSEKKQIQPIQYVKSYNEPKCKNEPIYKNKFANKTSEIINEEIYQGPMTKEIVFKNIWCWGDYDSLYPLVNTLTIDEINMLIDHIDYKLHDIEGWANPERDLDRTKDLEKCKIILIKQKIKCISKFQS